MISIRFEERQQIGLQYALETLHGCSPFGQEKIRRLRYYTPAERAELETELYNVQQAADHADQLKGVYDKICILLCQMKDIRNSIRRCRDGEVPDHVELFEIKGYLQRLESLLPLYAQMSEVAPLRELSFHDPKPALAILDPDNTRSRGFYIPDSMTEKLRQVRRTKKELEERLHEAQTDAEKDELRLRRTQICAEEESEETELLPAAVTRADTVDTAAKKLLQSHVNALTETHALVDAEALRKAADYINHSDQVRFFGLGGSMLTAMEGMYKFLHIMPNVYCLSDVHMQTMGASTLNEHDVAIFISHSGASKEIVQMAQKARAGGARTVAITRYAKSPLAEYMDVVLLCGGYEPPLQEGSFPSKTAQLFVLDLLFTEVYRTQFDYSKEINKRVTTSILDKNY